MERQQEISIVPPPPLSFFLIIGNPLVNISFFPEPSTAEKVRDGSYNFHQENAC